MNKDNFVILIVIAMEASIVNELLFEDIKSGDVYAFEILFHRYYKKLCRYCRTIVKKTEVAEEIAVDVLHKLWTNREDIVITIGMEQYLYRSVHNRALNHIRDRRRSEIEIVNVSEFTADPAEEDSALHAITSGTKEGSFYDQLDTLLSALPLQQQQILNLRKGGLTHKEIAGRMELPEKKVRNLADRTIQKLREQVKISPFSNNRLPPDVIE
jgi:RNA polymerase sigma-70 factor (ECF subfamily)